MRVAVPFARAREVGVCVGLSETSALDPHKIRDIERVLDPEPILDAGLLRLTRWLADYYVCSWGEALAAVLPPPLKRESERKTVLAVAARPGARGALPGLERKFDRQFRLLRWLLEAGGHSELAELSRKTGLSLSPVKSLEKKGLLEIRRIPARPGPLFAAPLLPQPPVELNAKQKEAVAAIAAGIASAVFHPFLLYGITGSGKTEVYLHAMEAALRAGRGAIILVPEISLTPQTVGRFRARFGEVAVLHSRLTDSQRLAEWRRIRGGKARVVVGARSAVFAPMPRLGLLVVDEEHEPSFKQQNSPRYHARDVAVYRAQLEGAAVVLGSATPSLESYRNASQGKYRLLTLPERVSGGRLPAVHLVDLRTEMAEGKSYLVFSRLLVSKVQDALRRGEQAILFLNRRGFSPVLFCRQCGSTVRCRRCDIALAFHRRLGRAVCHSCRDEIPPPRECPECGVGAILYLGTGSEKVEARLREIFPEARIARMDSDTMVRRESYEEVLERFRRREVDLLVGTQMIAKGLDFPDVTVVGVVSADTALHVPDFRASERAFQLVSQVAGRAGRGPRGGEVIVQSALAGHEAIRAAIEHDYEGFARRELAHRRPLGYPPFGRAVRILVEGKSEAKVQRAAEGIRSRIQKAGVRGVETLGPAAAPIARLRDRHRWHLLLKVASAESLRALRPSLHEVAARDLGGVKIAVDVDPVTML